MKKTFLLLIIFAVLFVSISNALNSWSTTGYDIFRSYTQQSYSVDSGLSYNTLARTLSGRYDTEPLIYDLDEDGSNEMLIIEGTTIYVYDSALQIEAQRSVTLYGYNSIVSNPIIFNMNTSNSKLEVGIVLYNSTDGTNDLIGFDITGPIITKVFKIRNIKQINSEFRVLASDMRSLHNYYIKDKRFFRIYNDKTFICEVDLGVNDTKTSSLSMPQEVDYYSTNWLGDFNGDGVIDIAFWHNNHIMVYDVTCNRVLDFNANSYSNTVSNYQPIIFVNFDGGDQELVTTTNGGYFYSMQTNSYVIALNNLNNTVFLPVSHHCAPLSGAPDANILNVIKMNINTNGGEYNGDEVVAGIVCDSLCTGCGSDGMSFEYFNENGAKGFVKANSNTFWSGTKSRFAKSSLTGGTSSNSVVFVQQINQAGGNIASGSLSTNNTNHLKYTSINSSIKTFTGALNLILDDGIVLADLDGDNKNDIIYSDSFNGKIIIELSGETVVDINSINFVVGENCHYYFSGTVCDEYVQDAKVYAISSDGYVSTGLTNSLGIVNLDVTNMENVDINVTVDGYNTYREFDRDLEDNIFPILFPNMNEVNVSKLIDSPVIFDNVYSAVLFMNFSTANRKLSLDGWSSNSYSIMNNDGLQGIDYQSRGKMLKINATSIIGYVHESYLNSIESEMIIHVKPSDSSCMSCDNYTISDGVRIQLIDEEYRLISDIRVWNNLTRWYIDYYNETYGDWITCGIKAYDNAPLIFRIKTTNYTYSFQYFYADSSKVIYPTGYSDDCVLNKEYLNENASVIKYILMYPQASSDAISAIHYIDYLTFGEVITSGCEGNLQSSITGIGYATGLPICVDSAQSWIIDIYDVENDYYTLQVDCYGDGNWSDWTYFGSGNSYMYPCTYDKVGSFIAKFRVSDLCHWPGSYDEKIQVFSVATSNCFEEGEGGESPSDELAGDFGFIDVPYSDVVDGYTSTYFDMSYCNSWQTTWRAAFLWLCPVYSIGLGILQTIFNFIFSSMFGYVLIIILLIVLYVLIRIKKR